ncbi:Nin one binding Zn-ribbon like-domain-containing protein [Crucibulum laeve]|uniref:20S-pre-rRNA D-site endonuclease NOB1 n=1 Tax=Crucibulum laeve TaxID=68775 RepID=A0A5C3MR45_9AGAR|nr:Nin one binding Zn-ribbon like-domain-containing protein [Crucibulum laeve]
MEKTEKPRCKNLVLDAGPLLSLSPLRGLAETYLTVPQVLSELKDNRAREHFERLGLLSGVKVAVKSPDPISLAHVIQWAKKTGDYSVLSHADICVLALTYSLHEEEKRKKESSEIASTNEQSSSETQEAYQEAETPIETVDVLSNRLNETSLEEPENSEVNEADDVSNVSQVIEEEDVEEEALEPLDVELHPVNDEEESSEPRNPTTIEPPASRSSPIPIYDDPSDSDDGEGEWITPSNVSIHKSRALDLLPGDGVNGKGKGKAKDEAIGAGCMTADFAMQNVLLQMGLNLVSIDGKRIEKVKSWVLRCHACFKICKDNSKKFCPSCGNPTLLRASVTVASPNASANAPAMQVHLKPNFQYKIRGTKYSIPAPKHGSAKTGPGEGLILREDQAEYQRAKKMVDGKREREETRMLKGILAKGVSGNSTVGVSSWMDPDWVPEMISVGSGGKGRTVRSSRMDGDMPQIGHGRKNPNERKRRK